MPDTPSPDKDDQPAAPKDKNNSIIVDDVLVQLSSSVPSRKKNWRQSFNNLKISHETKENVNFFVNILNIISLLTGFYIISRQFEDAEKSRIEAKQLSDTTLAENRKYFELNKSQFDYQKKNDSLNLIQQQQNNAILNEEKDLNRIKDESTINMFNNLSSTWYSMQRYQIDNLKPNLFLKFNFDTIYHLHINTQNYGYRDAINTNFSISIYTLDTLKNLIPGYISRWLPSFYERLLPHISVHESFTVPFDTSKATFFLIGHKFTDYEVPYPWTEYDFFMYEPLSKRICEMFPTDKKKIIAKVLSNSNHPLFDRLKFEYPSMPIIAEPWDVNN